MSGDGESIYQAACLAPDLREFITDLSAKDLRAVGGELARLGEINDIPGKVWSHVIYEAAQRFLKGGVQ